MRLAIAQMKTLAGDFAATADRMVEYSRRAADQGVDLLVFPMNVLSGAAEVPYVDREGFLLDLAEALMGLTERLACPCLVPATADVDGNPVPEAMLVTDGDVRPLRLGAYLENAVASPASVVPRQAKEGPAPTLPEVEVAGARVGIACGYDDLDDYDDYDFDVNVIIYLSTYGYSMDDASSALGPALVESRFVADARATRSWIVGVGSLGCYDAETFTGSSFVLAPWGEVAAQAPALEEALLVCDIDPASEGPLERPLVPEVFDRATSAWGALSLGLAETCAQLGASDVALLLDGRLGSSVVAVLATDALGPTHVHALIAPGLGPVAAVAVRELTRALRLDVRELPPAAAGDGDGGLASDLVQAHLAALARELGGIALSPHDKTGMALEPACGLDAGALAPLGDVYRSDVVALARMRNTVSPVIPAAARDAYGVPDLPGIESCGMGVEARLEFCDYVLASYVEWESPVSDIVEARGHERTVLGIVDTVRRGSFLRRREPPVLMMSSKLLDEVRSPLGLAWCDRVRPQAERLDAAFAAFDAETDAAASSAPTSEASPTGAADGEKPASATSNAQIGHDAHELLGLLRDVSLGGGLSLGGDDDGSAGRHSGPARPDAGLWNGPFSEN